MTNKKASAKQSGKVKLGRKFSYPGGRRLITVSTNIPSATFKWLKTVRSDGNIAKTIRDIVMAKQAADENS